MSNLHRDCHPPTFLYQCHLYVAFRGDFYQQSFGTAKGSPVSVTIADLVMEDIEQRALSSFHTSPMFWKRYVDDTCTAICSDHLDEFLQHLNSIEPTIKFTCETEEDCRLPFLDTEITRHPDGSLSTKVYQKKTHRQVPGFHITSHHPLSHKLAVVNTLQSRAKTHCTFVNDRTAE